MSSTEKVILTEGSLEDIADAIREKNGTETTYKPREMAPAIRALNTNTDWGEIGGTLSDQTDLQDALNGKVDKVTGKQLSTEDYTTAEKTKLGALPNAATLNADLASKADDSVVVKSVNGNLPTNGEVTLNAEDIPADGIGDKSVSGNPIIIEDGMASVAKELSVTLEPIQDLYGYDHPWAGGAGKNLFDFDGWLTANNVPYTKSGNAYTFEASSILFRNPFVFSDMNMATNFLATMTVPSGSTIANFGFELLTADNTIAALRGDLWSNKTGCKLRFNFSTGGKITVEAPILTTADKSVTPFEPYSNICPITGHDSCAVLRRGINQWNEIAVVGGYDSQGNVSGNTDRIRNMNRIRVDGNTSYYFKSTYRLYLRWYDQYDNWISGTNTDVLNGVKTSPVNAYYLRFFVDPENGTTYNNDISINYPATDHDYHAYSEDTASVSFGQTVYGCTHDFVSGKCRVTRGIVDLGTLTWELMTGSTSIFTTNVIGRKGGNNFICSKYKTGTTRSTLYAVSPYNAYDTTPAIFVNDPTYTDATTFKNSTAGVQFVYELATPIELTLTPAQLSLLQGTNILTADGTINLTYLGSEASNVQDEIDEFEAGLNNVIGSIAFIENQVAKTSHAVGEYIILNGIFCKVIASISSGETLSFGTNIQATTIGAELKAIWAQIQA